MNHLLHFVGLTIHLTHHVEQMKKSQRISANEAHGLIALTPLRRPSDRPTKALSDKAAAGISLSIVLPIPLYGFPCGGVRAHTVTDAVVPYPGAKSLPGLKTR